MPRPDIRVEAGGRSRRLQALAYAAVAAGIALLVAAQSGASSLGWRVEAGVLTGMCALALWWLLGFALRSDVTGALAGVLLLGLAAFVSTLKQSRLSEPLYPWDLLLVREAMRIAWLYVPRWAWAAVAIGLAVLCAAAFRFAGGTRPRAWQALAAVAWLAFVSTSSIPVSAPFPARNMTWDLPANAANNGRALAFVYMAGALLPPRPAMTSRAAMAMLGVTHARAAAIAAPQPDVIVMLSEAWMDTATLGSTMQACLAPHARQRFVSPTFGGGTANVEFELMTGYPLQFAPRGTTPYRMYINHPLDTALPATFRRQGYETVGIHNFSRTYWNRDRVYPLLGFDRFVGLENLPARTLRGAYPDDALVFDAIRRELDRPDNAPRFIFAATVMNHGPYAGVDRYPRQEALAPAVAAALDPAERIVAGNYVAISHDFEAMLCGFLDYAKSRTRETIVVVFGDHWPALGPDMAVFHELGIVPRDADTVFDVPFATSQAMHRTPLVAWSNRRGDLAMGDGAVPAYALGAEALAGAGLPVDGAWADELAHYRDTTRYACCYRDPAGRDIALRETAGYDALYRDAYDRLFAAAHD